MKFSVIIPALDEQTRISDAIKSAQIAGADEIIVVDGGSCDETRSIAEGLGCRVVTASAGRGVQQHRGATIAKCDILVFLHADNRLGSHCLRQVERLFCKSTKQFGIFRQQFEGNGWQYRLLERGNAMRVRAFGLTYGDQGIFVRRDFYFKTGGFPQWPLMEDVAFARAASGISFPAILPGPIRVSSRRWRTHGFLKQTLRNWILLTAFSMGVSADRIANFYRQHDE